MIVVATLVVSCGAWPLAAAEPVSHPPLRPLPEPSDRPPGDGPAFYVDAAGGDDEAAGSREQPWRTVQRGLRQLAPGETLYLRGGTYYEHVDVPRSGEEGRPITLRSFPGELAVIDGGLREFFESPRTAWQPFPGGAEHEYVSTRTYPELAARPIVSAFVPNAWEPFHGIEDQRPLVLGHFGDSMVPLHGYRSVADLRDTSMLWDVDQKFDQGEGVYCGPGLWFNRETGRIHVRLAHTTLEGLGGDAYRGVTDPREVPLAISGAYGADVLRLNGVRHVVVQDIVLRGAGGSPLINVYGAEGITFDGVTVFGGAPGLLVNATTGLKVLHSAFRSLAAPWSSRASMKYRGTPSYVVITHRSQPPNRDFELAWNEFTDGHDFAWVRDVKDLRFHHNFIENFNDDGLEVGAKKRDHELYVYQNVFSRCLITFTLHEIEPDESPAEVDAGSGVFITRNIVDLRRGTFKAPPREPDATGAFLNQTGALCSDHGSPTWPQYMFYHNTVLRTDPAWRGYYGFGMGAQGLRNTQRRVLNNVFVQLEGLPGLSAPPEAQDVFVDGNLHWSLAEGPGYEGDFFRDRARATRVFPEGALQHDLFADPRFELLTPDPSGAADFRLREGSPAVNAGVVIPEEWLDPLRESDRRGPDLGAFPLGAEPLRVGVRGRLK
jgi:hypothetical protein